MAAPATTVSMAAVMTIFGIRGHGAFVADRRCHPRPVMSRAMAAGLLVFALAGCGSEAVSSYPPAAEPPVSPPLAAIPAGRVVPVGREPEGVAVDPEDDVVAVGLRGPALLALRDEDGVALRQVRLA